MLFTTLLGTLISHPSPSWVCLVLRLPASIESSPKSNSRQECDKRESLSWSSWVVWMPPAFPLRYRLSQKEDAGAHKKVSVAVTLRPVQTPPKEMLQGNHHTSQLRQFYFSAFITHTRSSKYAKESTLSNWKAAQLHTFSQACASSIYCREQTIRRSDHLTVNTVTQTLRKLNFIQLQDK